MIPIGDELKSAVINEVIPKILTMSCPNDIGIESLNWYSEQFTPSYGVSTSFITNRVYDLTSGFRSDLLNLSCASMASRLVFSCYIKTDVAGDYFVKFSYTMADGTTDYSSRTISVPANTFTRLYAPYIKNTIVSVDSIELWYAGDLPQSMNFIIERPQLDLKAENDGTPLEYNNTLFATSGNVETYIGHSFLPVSNSHIISESFSFKESICSAEKLKFGLCEASEIELDVFDVTDKYIDCVADFSLKIGNVTEEFEWKDFVISEAKKRQRGDIITRHIVAYNRLTNLIGNAYSWYSQYMFGMNMDVLPFTSPNLMFDFGRQIFSTYWNLATNFGVDDISNAELESIESFDTETNKVSNMYFDAFTVSDFGRIHFCKKTYTPRSSYKAYRVEYETNAVSGTLLNEYDTKFDSLRRGIAHIACVYVAFNMSDNTVIGQLFDNGDCFVIPSGCTSFDVYIPYAFCNGSFTDSPTGKIVSTVNVQGIKSFNNYDPTALVNGANDLPYHSYKWRKPTMDNIIKAYSNITARDVMRSLMEMCGCFFKLDRNGKPQFFYPIEHGLYPANTLFPADDLFPKKSSEMTMPTSYYMTAEFEEFRVSNWGGVQVVVDSKDNTGTVCRWEYWGDDDLDNAYIIDDNIFLCSEQLEYEQDAYPEIETLLQNLYGVLNNLSYTPFTATTIGTPFLESGDRFTLLTKSDGFESFIFERTLKGIQALKDTYEARGVAKTPRVKTFEWGNQNS